MKKAKRQLSTEEVLQSCLEDEGYKVINHQTSFSLFNIYKESSVKLEAGDMASALREAWKRIPRTL